MNKISLLSSQLSKHLNLPLAPPGEEIVSVSGIGGGRVGKKKKEREKGEEEEREAGKEGGRKRVRKRKSK